jgi:hypothetical protein
MTYCYKDKSFPLKIVVHIYHILVKPLQKYPINVDLITCLTLTGFLDGKADVHPVSSAQATPTQRCLSNNTN